MEHASDGDTLAMNPVVDDVGADGVLAQTSPQLLAAWADVRGLAKEVDRGEELVKQLLRSGAGPACVDVSDGPDDLLPRGG